jgi:hypothetical protein
MARIVTGSALASIRPLPRERCARIVRTNCAVAGVPGLTARPNQDGDLGIVQSTILFIVKKLGRLAIEQFFARCLRLEQQETAAPSPPFAG